MAPVLKTGEALRVSVGSNPTPSALNTEKAPLTCGCAGRRGISHTGADLTQSHLISLGLTPLPKYGPSLAAGLGCVALVTDVAERLLNPPSPCLVLPLDALCVDLQQHVHAVPPGSPVPQR